jgi:hypothetical protein
MKKISALFLVCLSFLAIKGQDSAKVITHEAGVNIFALFAQVDIFDPSPNQLPYDVFYNCYFKRAGVRTGLGINNNRTETKIEGQEQPRITTAENTYLRIGASYQVATYKKVTINAFVDYIYQKQGIESTTTTTIQVFPNPISTRTVRGEDMTEGKGIQGGVGLMLHMNRHLSLYTETPVSYLVQNQTVEDFVSETGEADIITKSTTRTSGIKIALPVTIYLVFRI